MASAMMRISATARSALRELAAQQGESMQAILDKAVEQYRRRCLLEQANAAFAALRRNKRAWKQELIERAEWDTTLTDGQAEG